MWCRAAEWGRRTSAKKIVTPAQAGTLHTSRNHLFAPAFFCPTTTAVAAKRNSGESHDGISALACDPVGCWSLNSTVRKKMKKHSKHPILAKRFIRAEPQIGAAVHAARSSQTFHFPTQLPSPLRGCKQSLTTSSERCICGCMKAASTVQVIICHPRGRSTRRQMFDERLKSAVCSQITKKSRVITQRVMATL